MLQVLRESMKYLAWVLWAVIAVFVLFVFVDFGGGVQGPMRANQVAATVGEDSVSYQEFQRVYRNLEDQERRRLGQSFDPDTAREQLPMLALNRLVDRRIMEAEADHAGIVVTDAEVRRSILVTPGFQDAEGRFVGADRYKMALRRLGYTPQQFEDNVRSDLLVGKLLDALGEGVYITDAQLLDRYRREQEKAQVAYLELPSLRLRSEVEIPEDQMAAYFDEHREELRIPDRRRASLLIAQTAPLRGAIEVSEEDAQAYYEENLSDYEVEEQVRARHILVGIDGDDESAARATILEAQQRLENGEEFATVASELSDDTGSASRGGDLGYFGRGRMVAEFEQAAFTATPGELVGPIRTQFGFHLIEVLDRREAGTRPFESVRAQVESRVASARAETEAEALIRTIQERIANEPGADFEALAAENEALVVREPAAFGRADVIEGIGRAPELVEAVFALGEGETSGPAQVGIGWVLARLLEVQPSRLPEMAEVEADIRNALQDQAAQDLALERLAEGRGRIEAGEVDLEGLAEELGVPVRESGEFGDEGFIPGLGLNPELAEAALALQEGDVGEPITSNRGAILFEVRARRRFDPQAFETAADQLRARVHGEEIEKLLTSVLEQRRRELSIGYDPALAESLGLVGEGADTL